ncbi:MAG TPA: sulfur carrier protein ThiS [Micropepsaceae bacterium]|nr:sulfur carrier protein ThiS [Micropepsaceae bacterium]HRK70586.1 sulfur carrier protein ThiS [Micropepsaceae bacterium]
MRLTINGEVQDLAGPLSVAGLLERLRVDRRKVAVERNLAIVPRAAYETAMLEEGDRIEIVAFIGGG